VSAPEPAAPSRWEALAREAAGRGAGLAPTDAGVALLVFELAGALHALPVERVREIVRVRPVTPVPRVPAEVLGVTSLRGEIVQVIDLRRRLGLAAASLGRDSRVVVVGGERGAAGLLVDGVREVLFAGGADLLAPTAEARAVEALYRRGDRFVSVLDLDRLLDFDAAR
jgi:purine-binding chemotaxis protein CheW